MYKKRLYFSIKIMVCVHISMQECVCMCVGMRACLCVCVYTCQCMSVYMYEFMQACSWAFVCACVCTHLCTSECVCICVCVHVYTCIQHVCVCVCVCVSVCVSSFQGFLISDAQPPYTHHSQQGARDVLRSNLGENRHCDCDACSYIRVMSHWVVSQQVVSSGWSLIVYRYRL